jgi:hypothetical protein
MQLRAKQNAMKRLGCGLLNKVVLSFFTRLFWQDSDFLELAHPANSYLVLDAATFLNKPILTQPSCMGHFRERDRVAGLTAEIVADCMEV